MKPKTFEQKLKRDMYAMGVLFLIFLAVFILTKMGILPESPFSSLGFSGAICSGVQLVRMDTLLRDEEKRAQAEVSRTDERNIFIEKQAYSAYTMLSLVCLFAAILVCGIIAPQIAEILIWVLAGNAVIIVGCIFYYSKKY
ncbi:MAG: hypothetical protein ACLVEN_08205 [Anaerotignum lactatifermentans]|uniref:hypothetical protein n=1 Tax=Anaerotignum lactatifermentans TaxID=160404 RepID=UPI00399ABC37